jgi:hypothetical protein
MVKKKFLGYFNCANKASDAYQDKLKEIVTNKNK